MKTLLVSFLVCLVLAAVSSSVEAGSLRNLAPAPLSPLVGRSDRHTPQPRPISPAALASLGGRYVIIGGEPGAVIDDLLNSNDVDLRKPEPRPISPAALASLVGREFYYPNPNPISSVVLDSLAGREFYYPNPNPISSVVLDSLAGRTGSE